MVQGFAHPARSAMLHAPAVPPAPPLGSGWTWGSAAAATAADGDDGAGAGADAGADAGAARPHPTVHSVADRSASPKPAHIGMDPEQCVWNWEGRVNQQAVYYREIALSCCFIPLNSFN